MWQWFEQQCCKIDYIVAILLILFGPVSEARIIGVLIIVTVLVGIKRRRIMRYLRKANNRK